MVEEQLAELQNRFDSERNTNKQLENKKTELARECVMCVYVCVHICVQCVRMCVWMYNN